MGKFHPAGEKCTGPSGSGVHGSGENRVAYCCPQCRHALQESASELRCTACGVSYPLVEGIPMLSRNRDFYYGEIPRPDMRAILERAPSLGLEAAVTEQADRSGSLGFYRYAYSQRRSAGKFFLGHFEKGTVLDFGCGLGAITSSLAQNFARVYSTDLTWERAAFTRCRTRQLGLDNVSVFVSGDMPHLPLPPASVDAAIINGVLEWLPQFLPGDPREIQLAFLRDLSTILRPGGCVFLGIENRMAYGYFLGEREEHSDMIGVSLLPRRLANVYSRIVRGKPYRNYTYTLGGYRKLFREAGFTSCDFVGFVPSYLIPRAGFKLADPVMIDHSLRKDTLRKRVRNVFVRPLLAHTAPSLGVLAGKGTVPSFVDSLLAHLSQTTFAGNPLQLLRYDVTATGKVNLTIAAGQQQYLVKLPLVPEAQARTLDEVGHLETIAISPLSSVALAPRVLDKGYFRGQYFALEQYLGDSTGDELPPRLQVRVLELTRDYAIALARNSAVHRSCWSELLSAWLLPYGREMDKLYSERFGGNDPARFSTMIARLLEAEGGSGAFTCASHGDLWLSNVMVDNRATRLLGVIDWNQFNASSLPLLDLFHLVVKFRQEKDRSSLGDAVVGLYRDILSHAPHADLVLQYAREFSISLQTAANLLVAYWLRQTTNMLRGRAILPGAVIRQSIDEPLVAFSSLAQAFHEVAGTTAQAAR